MHLTISPRATNTTGSAFRSYAVIIFLIAVSQSTSAPAQVTSSFVEPYELSELAAAEPGVVAEVGVTEGQRVQAGEVMAKLNHAELLQALRLAELRSQSSSRVTSARAMLAIRRRQKESIEPLLAAGHANPAEVEKAVSEYQIALADLELAEEEASAGRIEVERIRAKMERRFIRSPLDGVVVELHRHPGEYVASANPRVATVARLDRLRVRFYLTEPMIADLRIGQSVTVQLGVQLRSEQGTVEFVSPVTDPQSGTARVDIVLENDHESIRSGTPCFWPSDTAGIGEPKRSVRTSADHHQES